MFEISLKDFRGFHEQSFVPIKPVTVLIGENSAGKSSFLAALKYLLDFTSRKEEPNFNRDPFQLGTFDQIAHFRGGRGGRAKEFHLTLRSEASLRRSRARDAKETHDIEVAVHFTSVDSHAAVETIRISSSGESIQIKINNSGISIEFINAKGQRFPIGDPGSTPPVARSEFARYWPFIIRDLNFRIGRRESKDQEEIFPDNDRSISRIIELATDLTRVLTSKNEATSAIRTKPQRTYTPGTEKEDGEGSHVPYEIAKKYRSRAKNRSEWDNLKKSIERFGNISQMFKELSVKSFGKTASDPFQIQFSYDGPRTNLVDLGYGTSQVLPILYSIAVSDRNHRFLIQQPEVHLHPKAQAALGQFIVDAFNLNRAQFVLETHSDFIVDRIRLAIAQGHISNDNVSLLFFERKKLENLITVIDLDSNGEPADPPESYRAFFIDEQMKILGL